MKKLFQQYQSIILFLLPACFLVIFLLLPIFRVGLVADSLYSYRFFLQEHSLASLIGDYQDLPSSYLRSITGGRIHLFFTTIGPTINFFESFGLFFTHLRTIIFTLSSLFLLYLIFKQLKLSESKWSHLALVFLPLLFQIRAYHDPFIVFSGNFQFSFAFFLLSVLFFIKYLQKNKLSTAIISLIFFSFSAHSHEAQIMFWPNMLLVFYLVTHQFFTKKIWPLFIMAVSCIHSYFAAQIWQFILQIPLQNYNYDGVTVNFSLVEIVKTWLIQIAAALPLSSFFGRTGQEALSYYPHLYFDNLAVFFLALLVFGIIFTTFYYRRKYFLTKINWLNIGLLSLLGFSLWILPALPVALSAKYQADLNLFGMKSGQGYLMVYYQYFGVAILFAIAFYLIFIHCKYKKVFLSCGAIICATIFYLTYCTNLASIKQVNKAYDEQRFIVNQALAANFFHSLEQQTVTLYLTHRDTNYYAVDDHNLLLTQGLQYLFKNRLNISHHCFHNELFTFPAQTALGACDQLYNDTNNNYFLYYDQVDEYSGYIILAPVTGFYQGIPTGTQVAIFYYSAYLNDNWPGGIFPALRRDLFTSYYVIDENNQYQQQHHRQWIVRDRQTNSAIVKFNSLQPILLDSLVPQLVQNDRESLQLIAPVN